MVGALVKALGGNARDRVPAPVDEAASLITCYHVDCRLSENIAAIGRPSWKKVFLVIRYCLQAIVCRWRHGVSHFYYVPAPGLRAAVYRDWIVMALCRPFFPVIIYHWHAVGLGDWIERSARPWERWISRRLLARPELSIVLGEFNRRDALQLESTRVVVVANGIPDPCDQFENEVLPVRLKRAKERAALLGGGSPCSVEASDEGREFRVMFIGLCHREKGLFDAVEAVALVNRELAGTPIRVSLSVAGGFWQESDKVEFERRIGQPDLLREGTRLVTYLGFVSGDEKRRLFKESDCLCFPTYYAAESFGLVVLEAMAWGLHVVTTNWRTVPELLPSDYPGIVRPRSPRELADKLFEMVARPHDPGLRSRFLECYTVGRFADNIRKVLNETIGGN